MIGMSYRGSIAAASSLCGMNYYTGRETENELFIRSAMYCMVNRLPKKKIRVVFFIVYSIKILYTE